LSEFLHSIPRNGSKSATPRSIIQRADDGDATPQASAAAKPKPQWVDGYSPALSKALGLEPASPDAQQIQAGARKALNGKPLAPDVQWAEVNGRIFPVVNIADTGVTVKFPNGDIKRVKEPDYKFVPADDKRAAGLKHPQPGFSDAERSERPSAARALTAMLTMNLSYLLATAAYFLSVYQAYRANGFWMALLISIPSIGQLIWLGVMWSSSGFFNSFSYLILAAGACYISAHWIMTNNN
jgi:hypothetical protein